MIFLNEAVVRLVPKNASDASRGIICMVGAAFWFSIMSFLVKLVSSEIPVSQMILLRNVVGAVLFLPWFIRLGAPIRIPKRFDLFVARSLTGIMAMIGFFYAIQRMPLPTVISLTFAVPLLTAMLAAVILGERMGVRRWSALFVGFGGVLLVARPEGGVDMGAEALALGLTVLCWAFSGIIVKKLTQSASPQHMAFGMFVLMIPLALPFVLYSGWTAMSTEDMFYIVLLAICAVQGQIFLSSAFGYTDMGTVLPFDYLRLVFAGVLSYIFFGEALTPLGMVGTAVIIGANLYVLHRERQVKRRNT